MRDYKKFLLLIVPGMLLLVPAAYSAFLGSKIDEFLEKDPVCNKYFYRGEDGSKSKTRYDPDGKYWKLKDDCSYGLYRCKVGYDAFLGKPDETLSEYWADSLSHTESKEWNDNPPIWRLTTDEFVGARASQAVTLWNIKDADVLVAKTISTLLKQESLWCTGKSSYNTDKFFPYRTLWYLGARNQADTMIKSMAIPPENFRDVGGYVVSRCHHTHRNFFFAVAHEWKLSAEQNKAIVELCQSIFQHEDSDENRYAPACVRYLSAIKTTDKDTIEFIKKFLTDTGDVFTEAIRAAGRLGLKEKGVKDKLLATIKDNENEKTVNKKKVIWYRENNNIGESVVALYALGDSSGEKVIKSWLLWNKADKELDNAGGFEVLMREAPFVAESHRKKLADLIKKTYPDVVKISKTNAQYKRFARKAAAALLQMGDKAGLEHVLEIIKDGDKDEVKELFRFLGADNSKYGTGAFGSGGILIGKTGLSEKEAQSIIDTIKARFKFWNDTDQKELGILASLDIQARIKASKF